MCMQMYKDPHPSLSENYQSHSVSLIIFIKECHNLLFDANVENAL